MFNIVKLIVYKVLYGLSLTLFC